MTVSNIKDFLKNPTHDYDGGVYFDDLSKYITSFGYQYKGNTELCSDGIWGDALFKR